VTFNKFIQNASAKNLYIAHCEPTEKKYLKNLTQNNKDIIILIGPEGDFSSDEIHQALEKNYVPISLGESRLRTETAGIIAVATVAINN
jgi:16S rRNA (uracil1498-N3)-methyltransferase